MLTMTHHLTVNKPLQDCHGAPLSITSFDVLMLESYRPNLKFFCLEPLLLYFAQPQPLVSATTSSLLEF